MEIEAKNMAIDWNNPNVLNQIVEKIKNPLDTILEASKGKIDSNSLQYQVIFSNSKQISEIIEDIVKETQSKTISLSIQERPEIFDIYESNKNVQKLCSGELTSQKITKPDQDWLMGLEKEINDAIDRKDLDIYHLSYQMAVSQRQLYRKTIRLTCLTPNKYIRVLRLHKAKKMIENYLQHSISQIAYTVGYNDTYYFSKLFRNQYNVSPKELIVSMQ